MEFCKKCGGLMIVVGKKLKCRKCGWTKNLPKGINTVKSEEVSTKDEIVILEEDEEKKIHPVTRILCPECGNTKAYWWMQQTRGADEPPTMFYKCTKCGYSWREY